MFDIVLKGHFVGEISLIVMGKDKCHWAPNVNIAQLRYRRELVIREGFIFIDYCEDIGIASPVVNVYVHFMHER